MKMEEDTELRLLFKYPLISKTSKGGTLIYKGSVYVKEEYYEITITESSDNNFTLTLPEELTPFKDEIDEVVTKLHPKNIEIVLDAVSSFIETKVPSNKLVDHSDTYKHILYEYWDFTRFYLNIKSSCLAYDLSKVDISTLDQAGRQHAIQVSFNFYDEDLFSITSSDLPQGNLFKKSSSLKDIYDQFLAAVEVFQPFFDLMEVFDRHCWVLDPERPKRSHDYRRIWIEENFSVIITVNPSDVSRLPDIKFLGPERSVDKYRDALNANLCDWDPSGGVFSGILSLLGLECFPQKPAASARGSDLLLEDSDCSICFTSRLNNKLPEVVCNNKSCEKHYHAECLYEWLMAVNARRLFTEVVGQCPNCEKNIACPIPK
ncbi:hypothetical protein NQ315_002342 [Exocentrus adspersus]|uniref:E3 ubiquitin-protein ligase FANCL n=1 Tax=Exocentrus adspersus TaxID=1586481 RepID=A0AAV8VT97_9CUCU|nr:hypothetical protein NQ315_002342 [Exocentrus adspersus]